ncbi:MAG: hypothetical protein K0R50_618 [Eubacterium sp.]|nr:hypothetical protein [Eubacterium sp.]
MYYFYMVIFLIGVLYTFVSLIIGGISGAFHSGGDVGTGIDGHLSHHGHVELGHVHTDAGHLGHIQHGGQGDLGHHGGTVNGDHGHAADGGSGSNGILSWFAILLNPMVAVSFLTVFGGLGIMGVKLMSWNSLLIFISALAAGIAVSALLYNFVAKPIYRSENTSDVSRDRLIGMPAEVTTDILEKGYGTIKYTVNSIMYTGPAKHIDEKSVKQGRKVVICKIENNTFYVSELSETLS